MSNQRSNTGTYTQMITDAFIFCVLAWAIQTENINPIVGVLMPFMMVALQQIGVLTSAWVIPVAYSLQVMCSILAAFSVPFEQLASASQNWFGNKMSYNVFMFYVAWYSMVWTCTVTVAYSMPTLWFVTCIIGALYGAAIHYRAVYPQTTFMSWWFHAVE